MTAAVILSIVTITTAGAVLGRAVSGRADRWPRALRTALGHVLESAGWVALFLAVNAVVGAAVILAVRVVTGRFVSIYVLDDVVLVILSALQAALMQGWPRRCG